MDGWIDGQTDGQTDELGIFHHRHACLPLSIDIKSIVVVTGKGIKHFMEMGPLLRS